MAEHKMLWNSSSAQEDLGHSAMKSSKKGESSDLPATAVSVFGRGASSAQGSAHLDLELGREIFLSPSVPMFSNPSRAWESLGSVAIPANSKSGNCLFLETTNSPAVVAFDILRTRLLHGLAEHNWRRVAISSPTHGCGKSFVASNLALSLARRPASRTVLMDLDLRRPQLASILGQTEEYALTDYLSGNQPLESVFRRYGKTLALGLNTHQVENASAVLHDPETVAALAAVAEQLAPEVVLYDLPPALVNDDLIALAPCIDAVLLVTDGTKTSPEEIRAFEKLLEGHFPLLGVVLNRAQDAKSGRYRYGKN
jgi:protein-tyrosine kinase